MPKIYCGSIIFLKDFNNTVSVLNEKMVNYGKIYTQTYPVYVTRYVYIIASDVRYFQRYSF